MTRRLSGLVLVFGSGCTIWCDVPPPEPTLGLGGGIPGEPTCLSQHPGCLTTRENAAELCGLVAECPEMAATIAMSTGILLATLNDQGEIDKFSYSVCVDTLTMPIEEALPRYSTIQSMLHCLVADGTCMGPSECTFPFEAIAGTDTTLCPTAGQAARCAEGNVLIDCENRILKRCTVESHYPDGTECRGSSMGNFECFAETCSQSASLTCEENGTTAVLCWTGRETSANCELYGLSCSEPDGCASSTVPDVRCMNATDRFQRGCWSPDEAKVCAVPTAVGPLWTSLDCGAMGRICDGNRPMCLLAESGCDPLDANADICEVDDPGEIRMCIGGEWVFFDCGTIGRTCKEGDSIFSGRCE